MSNPWPTACSIIFAIILCLGAILLQGCASLLSTNNFGSGEHQHDPLLDAAATTWQAHQH